jgi:hypothetical protein
MQDYLSRPAKPLKKPQENYPPGNSCMIDALENNYVTNLSCFIKQRLFTVA